MAMDVERFEFVGGGGEPLSGRIHMPAVEPIACAVFAHCFTCSKESRASVHISAALAEKGIATLRFDFTGLGESEGEFGGTTFSHNVDDIVAAAAALREAYGAPALLVGHSLGGSGVLAAAGQIPEAVGVATIGAPFDPKHVVRLFDASIEEITHMLHVNGIEPVYPEWQKRLDALTRRLIDDGTYKPWDGLPAVDFDDELLALGLAVYYDTMASRTYIGPIVDEDGNTTQPYFRLGNGNDVPLTPENLRQVLPDLVQAVEQVFPTDADFRRAMGWSSP